MHQRALPIAIAALTLLTFAHRVARAQQHSDIQFAYADGRIALAPAEGQPLADRGVWTAEWDTSGFFQQSTIQPGFASEAIDGLGIGGGDVIAYHTLSPLAFWDGERFAPPGGAVQVVIENNLGPDTVVAGDSAPVEGSVVEPYVNVIGDALPGGDFHSHLRFSLEPNLSPTPAPPPALGAYGVHLSLTTDALDVEDSAPFFIVFNFGLSDAGFARATEQFAALLGTPLPGDFNGDGGVTAADYTVWRDGLGTLYTAQVYAEWRAAYGAASPTASAGAIPEPAAGALLAGGLALLLTPRTRKERRP